MRPRVGLIGLGGIFKAHKRGYDRCRDAMSITAVCDVDREIAERTAADFPGAVAFTEMDAMLRAELIDAVDIMLPHSLHEASAAAAIEAGVNVLLEKPATPTVAAYDHLTSLARKRGVTLSVAENTRYVGAYIAAQRVLEAGELGEIQFVRTLIIGDETERLRNTSLWKGRRDGTVGGVIMDAGAHSFYLLAWLLAPASTLTAHTWRRVPVSEVEDVAVVVGELENGVQYSTEYSFTSHIPWTERAEIYGSRGSLIIDQLSDPVVKVYRGKQDFSGESLEVPYQPSSWKQESIASEVEDFVTSLAEGRSTQVRPEHVRAALVAIESAYANLA